MADGGIIDTYVDLVNKTRHELSTHLDNVLFAAELIGKLGVGRIKLCLEECALAVFLDNNKLVSTRFGLKVERFGYVVLHVKVMQLDNSIPATILSECSDSTFPSPGCRRIYGNSSASVPPKGPIC